MMVGHYSIQLQCELQQQRDNYQKTIGDLTCIERVGVISGTQKFKLGFPDSRVEKSDNNCISMAELKMAQD